MPVIFTFSLQTQFEISSFIRSSSKPQTSVSKNSGPGLKKPPMRLRRKTFASLPRNTKIGSTIRTRRHKVCWTSCTLLTNVDERQELLSQEDGLHSSCGITGSRWPTRHEDLLSWPEVGSAIVKSLDGVTLTDRTKILERWRDHFETNRPALIWMSYHRSRNGHWRLVWMKYQQELRSKKPMESFTHVCKASSQQLAKIWLQLHKSQTGG